MTSNQSTNTPADESSKQSSGPGIKNRVTGALKSAVFLSLPFVIFMVILHFAFMGLVALQGVPPFSFQFAFTNFGQVGGELKDSDEIVVLPPNSYFRRSMPEGLQLKDNGGKLITHFQGIRRSTPILKDKPAGVKRVLAIGDSFTWGAKLGDDETFPAQLERMLNAKPIPGVEKVEVLNAGIVSSTISNSYESLLNYDLQFSPDVVVVTFCDNDISDLATDTSISPVMYEFLRKSVWFGPVRYFFGKSIQKQRREVVDGVYANEAMDTTGGRFGVKSKATHIDWPEDVPAFLKTSKQISPNDIDKLLTLYYYSTTAWIMPFTGPDQTDTWALWREWEDYLVRIKQLGDQNGFKVVVNVYPIFARIYETQFDGQETPEKIIRDICERNGIAVVDELHEFRAREAAQRRAGEPLYFYPEDSHPTAAGGKIVAAGLEPVVRDLLTAK